ncbi:MAG: hypothetical protein IJP80_09065 [Bacteroidales bacterium]|nr:hypothetical protein [Bacteroidales bacterium]
MKRISRIIFLVSALLLLTVSCKKDKFDPDLLIGKWVNGSEYYRYDNGNTGVTWDVADDVHEDEAQAFKWEYDAKENTLTHIHWMEMTQDWTVPRVYTITELNNNSLKYTDKFGKTYSFTKTN